MPCQNLLARRLASVLAIFAAFGDVTLCSSAADAIIEKFLRNIQAVGNNGSFNALAAWVDRKMSQMFEAASLAGRLSNFTGAPAPPPVSSTLYLDTSGKRRTVRTMRKIAAGETFLYLPCEAIPTVDKVLRGPLGTELYKIYGGIAMMPSVPILALYVAWEVLHIDSSEFKEYFLLMPRVGPGIRPSLDLYRAHKANVDTPSLQNETTRLMHSVVNLSPGFAQDLKNAEKEQLATLGLAVDCIVPAIEREHFGGYSDDWAPIRAVIVDLVKALVTWAYDVVKSRSWGGSSQKSVGGGCSEEGGAIMLPIADLMDSNSRKGASTNPWAIDGFRVGWAITHAPEQFNANDEVFLAH